MEGANLIPKEIIENFNRWAVDDVYNTWEKWALELSSFAYKIAIVQARAESDSRTARMKEFLKSLAEFQQEVTVVNFKDLKVYTPRQKKDMR